MPSAAMSRNLIQEVTSALRKNASNEALSLVSSEQGAAAGEATAAAPALEKWSCPECGMFNLASAFELDRHRAGRKHQVSLCLVLSSNICVLSQRIFVPSTSTAENGIMGVHLFSSPSHVKPGHAGDARLVGGPRR